MNQNNDSVAKLRKNLKLNLRIHYPAAAIPSWKHHGSRKITEVKQLRPRLALGWVTIQGLEVDAVATTKVKS